MLVCFLSSGFISVSVNWGKRSCPWPLLVLSSLLFNIYMKPLDELIHHHGMRYHQYIEDSQLYISASGKFSNAVDALSQCLEVARNWRDNKRLQLNLSITEWLCVLRTAGSMPSLVMGGGDCITPNRPGRQLEDLSRLTTPTGRAGGSCG